uniref:Unannotated protein n=1 Tax=freshwater metagenome TaxID=449393 RepID=A0A6J7NZS4_9ZZZZ
MTPNGSSPVSSVFFTVNGDADPYSSVSMTANLLSSGIVAYRSPPVVPTDWVLLPTTMVCVICV